MSIRSDRRQADRMQLPAPYTAVEVRPVEADAAEFEGHLYDLSQTGLRLEIDEDLPIGTMVRLRMVLPGRQPVSVRARGEVVRCHDDELSGPIRLGIHFERFETHTDRRRLMSYLRQNGCRINQAA
ncbi:MAG: PilZ domain-containing protein [Phycisphaeraceae bacterium]|nr:PilZ domain-containing protein [Phycisphaeraceae bacterium]